MTKKKKTVADEVVENPNNLPSALFDDAKIDIKSFIRVIRGQQVMLDFDLAMLYGEKTSRLNEQVKRNLERFPDDFMFQLTKAEWNNLKARITASDVVDFQQDTVLISQIAISKHVEKRGGTQKQPYAFTRNGIAMLSSVLRSKTAIEVNKRIMRAFTAIPDLVNNNTLMMQRILNIEQHQTETDEKVNRILVTIEERTPKQLPEQVFGTGCVWDAWTYVSDMVRSAKERIILIDNFVDDRVLSLLDKRNDNVEATIYTRYNESFLTDLKKHNAQYRDIRFIQLSQRNHDRFLIIDETVYFLGASVKDMGVGLCAIAQMHTSPELILQLL
jgi:hypothetical protein